MDNGAEILTLYGQFDAYPGEMQRAQSVPLVSVLRDKLGDSDSRADRLRYVWLLTYARPSISQRFLSAVPFFYWRVGGAGNVNTSTLPKPLLDLGHPTHPVWNNVGRSLLQWVALDGTPIRASSRAYRTNLMDQKRLHVQEAIEFLRNAPDSTDGKGLSRAELDSLVGRLTLSKNLLGGLMQDGHLDDVAEARAAQRAESIGRNWELLRTSAERAGLYFEPLRIGGQTENYGVVWFPVNGDFSAPGVPLDTTWKLLHISNPWRDERLRNWKGYRQIRYLDASGALLPEGQTGPRRAELAPLAVYSLTYPKMPLLLMDFRSPLQTRRRELAQRTVDDLVSGVLGLSHFANWYYFAGNAIYGFVKDRRGGAVDRTDRLDCYSEFRVAIQLDRGLNQEFRAQLQRRLNGMSMNPLEMSASREVAMAHNNYQALQASVLSEKLSERIDKDRRRELATFGGGYRHSMVNDLAHVASFGFYTKRVPESDDNIPNLRRERITMALLRSLNAIADAGPSPEVSFGSDGIRASISQLADLAKQSPSMSVKRKAAVAIARVKDLSHDVQLRAECERAIGELRGQELPKLAKSSGAFNPGPDVPGAAATGESSFLEVR